MKLKFVLTVSFEKMTFGGTNMVRYRQETYF